jgi:hypothetical protein
MDMADSPDMLLQPVKANAAPTLVAARKARRETAPNESFPFSDPIVILHQQKETLNIIGNICGR